MFTSGGIDSSLPCRLYFLPFAESPLLTVNTDFVEIRALRTPMMFGMETFQILHVLGGGGRAPFL